jgi:TRAP-type C4-dicarboxylate transport system substrate-binding protein
LADVKGKKQRAYNASTSRMAALMETVPVTVQATDMAQAFQTGIVHGTSTSANTGVASKMHEFVSDVYLTNAWNPKQMGFIREAAFQKLTPSQQQALIFAGKKAEAIGWAQSIEIADGAPKILAEQGMKVHEPSDALMTELRGVGGTMLDEWLEGADAAAKAAVDAYKAAIGR